MKNAHKSPIRADAERLLALHGGACSVSQSSALAAEFLVMQQEGIVHSIRPSGTAGYIDIYAEGFKSRFQVKFMGQEPDN